MKFREIESNISIIIDSLAGNIDGASFLLRYITIQNTDSSTIAMELLYKKIVAILGRNQRIHAMKIINSLKAIRKIIIDDEEAKYNLNNIIETISQLKK